MTPSSHLMFQPVTMIVYIFMNLYKALKTPTHERTEVLNRSTKERNVIVMYVKEIFRMAQKIKNEKLLRRIYVSMRDYLKETGG